jgi:uncharacterized membrane protein
MDRKMERKFGIYAFGGLLIGAVLGTLWGAAGEHSVTGMVIGALVGVAIGWFIAAATLEKRNR